MERLISEVQKLQEMNIEARKQNMKIWDNLRDRIDNLNESNEEKRKSSLVTPLSGGVRKSFLQCIPKANIRSSIEYKNQTSNIFT